MQPFDRAAAPRVGHGLAFRAACQQDIGGMAQEVVGEGVAVFGVGVADQPQRFVRGVAADRLQHLHHRVRRVAQADDFALVEQRLEIRRQHIDRHEGQAIALQPRAGLVHVLAHGPAQRVEQRGGGDAAVEAADAVDQHRHAFARQQRGQQRHQVGLAARAVVAGDDHRQRAAGRIRRGQRQAAGVRGLQHAVELFRRLALDAVGHQDRAQLHVGHAAFEHGGEQCARVVLDQRAGAVRARPISLMKRAAGNGPLATASSAASSGRRGGAGIGIGMGKEDDADDSAARRAKATPLPPSRGGTACGRGNRARRCGRRGRPDRRPAPAARAGAAGRRSAPRRWSRPGRWSS